ncbi:hypothetical protein LINPERPRIM_LOCUS17094 [Linum perenne]
MATLSSDAAPLLLRFPSPNQSLHRNNPPGPQPLPLHRQKR